MPTDVTDATFETDVIARSMDVAVLVDLWAPWCGPCVQLGPILERVVDATDGHVVLTKVNVDENPAISQAFRVQSIPAVFAVKDGKVVDSFVGAQGEAAVVEFVSRFLPSEAETHLNNLLEAGDETSLREVLDIEPGNERAIIALADLLVARNDTEEGLALLARIPETPETKRIAALARAGVQSLDDFESQLDALLDQVKADDEARQRFVDLLEIMGPDDPRTPIYRRKLTQRLF
jgi:putative thioredoxin